jgi:hypothetical protein
MQDSFSELLRLLLPKIIIEYIELTSYKEEEEEEEILLLYLKEINSIPKENYAAPQKQDKRIT